MYSVAQRFFSTCWFEKHCFLKITFFAVSRLRLSAPQIVLIFEMFSRSSKMQWSLANTCIVNDAVILVVFVAVTVCLYMCAELHWYWASVLLQAGSCERLIVAYTVFRNIGVIGCSLFFASWYSHFVYFFLFLHITMLLIGKGLFSFWFL